MVASIRLNLASSLGKRCITVNQMPIVAGLPDGGKGDRPLAAATAGINRPPSPGADR
jgi:hypothetical protein